MLTKTPIIALILAIVHALSGLTLLLVSSWFIAASAVAGVSFNYMLPAVIIRALALMRIASGYGEMWLSHHQLLESLAHLRLSLFNNMQGSTSVSRASDTDKLNYQSQDIASIWTGWINQNAGALLSLLLLTGFVLWQLVAFSVPWLIFLTMALLIYIWLIMSGLVLAQQKQQIRTSLESQIEHHFDAANIWHMQKNLQHPDASALYKNVQTNQVKIEWAISGLLILSLFCITLLVIKMNTLGNNTPIVMILPMALLGALDWFGRTFFSHHRLHDYIIGNKIINSNYSTISNSRVKDKIETIELKQFKPKGSASKELDITFAEQQLHLIAGSSGSGKSRLFKAIAGLIDFDGDLFLNSRSIKDKYNERKAESSFSDKYILDDVLYVEQTPYVLSGTLRQNLQLAQHSAHRNANSLIDDNKLIEVLKTVGLDQLSNLEQWVGSGGRQLSGGETKRLGLARAILSTKRYILLDEPFEGLDQQNIDKVVNVINSLTTSRCVIIASHIYPEGLNFDNKIDLDSY
ncbi:ATP-binding cassette domain-containing protein [uncultured Psychrosphaera sp.]|uniref:ATP-binding cassette domain-containing protein n=1 Tax=uncultured Psychrosphaera sp. TaxID=1403522 RepID=UPI0030F7BBBE